MTKLITLTTLSLALASQRGIGGGLRLAHREQRPTPEHRRQQRRMHAGPTGRPHLSKTWVSKVRSYSCRVTREAMGTDPGFQPYTYARCQRGSRVIKMKLAS